MFSCYLFCFILNNVLFYVNPEPQGRTEATCIFSDWVPQVKEEINKERNKPTRISSNDIDVFMLPTRLRSDDIDVSMLPTRI